MLKVFPSLSAMAPFWLGHLDLVCGGPAQRERLGTAVAAVKACQQMSGYLWAVGRDFTLSQKARRSDLTLILNGIVGAFIEVSLSRFASIQASNDSS